MALGRRRSERQGEFWIAAAETASGPRHVFYERLNTILAEAGFDTWVEELCEPYYAEGGRPSIPPGVFFRMMYIGYFEAIDSQRGIAWRCEDSLSLKRFLGYPSHEETPDHSSLSRIRGRLPLEVFQEVHVFVLRVLGEHQLIDGTTVGVDSTVLEANAAMKSIVRKDSGEDWEAYVKRLAAELAHTAFEKEIVVDQPWVDMKGEKHAQMIGRPVSFHAMRGISAHSNGFQTCRALHLLQILLGSIDCPGGYRFKPPYPRSVEGQPKPHGGGAPNQPFRGPHLGFVRGPEDLVVGEDGITPQRIDKAFSWDAPLSSHGLMHMVIPNAHAGDPYKIELLFLYMANMSWNSSMNSKDVMAMLSDKDDNGEYVIPKIIYSDAYDSEMVAYADLILPDTTYLERHDCISLLDRPISEPDAVADSIRWPVVEPHTQAPGRDVRGFQSVLLDLGYRLGLPGMVDKDGDPKYKDYADYMVNHERRPGVGPLAGWRGKDGSKTGRGEPNPDQLKKYQENGGFFEAKVPPEARYFKHANKAWQDWAIEMGFQDGPFENTFQLYLEPLRKFQLCAEGKAEPQPPDTHRQRILDYFDPLPDWYEPFEGASAGSEDFPIHAITQRPAAMYHSWGSQNAWLRQIHGQNPLYVPGKICESAGLQTGDWAWVTSHHGRIKVPIARMDAVNENTVWTWNAIGKRAGAWNLDPDSPEAKKGFLLNHLIKELLPEKSDGMRWANSDPITGQAAWFDLKVRIEKAADQTGPSQPQFPKQKPLRTQIGRASCRERV